MRASAAAGRPIPHAESTRSSPRSGNLIAVVDTDPLYAASDADDQDHEACIEVLRRLNVPLVVPVLKVAEATYLVGRRMGPAEADSWRA